jgi:Wzt C-terminal domain
VLKNEPQVYSGRIIFDHLPKTAGTAVSAWLTKELGSGSVAFASSTGGDHLDLIRHYGGLFPVISAHMDFAGKGLDPRYQYITILREPIDRSLSWLFFVRNTHDRYELPKLWEAVEHFIASDGQEVDSSLLEHISNQNVEHFSRVLSSTPRSGEAKIADALSAIEQYDVWGLHEEMPAFLAEVAALFRLPPPMQIEAVNVTKSRPSLKEASPLLVKRLEALNALDLEFYRVMKDRWVMKRSAIVVPVDLPKSSPWMPYNPVRGRRFATSEISILSIALEGGHDFHIGDNLSFAVKFSLTRAVDDLMVGIALLDDYGQCALGTNTTMLGTPLLQVGEGAYTVDFSLPANLPTGQYTASFAFVERGKEGEHEIAWYDDMVMFRVSDPRPRPSVGYVSLPVEINLRQTSD